MLRRLECVPAQPQALVVLGEIALAESAEAGLDDDGAPDTALRLVASAAAAPLLARLRGARVQMLETPRIATGLAAALVSRADFAGRAAVACLAPAPGGGVTAVETLRAYEGALPLLSAVAAPSGAPLAPPRRYTDAAQGLGGLAADNDTLYA